MLIKAWRWSRWTGEGIIQIVVLSSSFTARADVVQIAGRVLREYGVFVVGVGQVSGWAGEGGGSVCAALAEVGPIVDLRGGCAGCGGFGHFEGGLLLTMVMALVICAAEVVSLFAFSFFLEMCGNALLVRVSSLLRARLTEADVFQAVA